MVIEGQIVPMDKRLVRRSRELSWLLRHGAAEAGVPMDPAGWVAVDHVLSVVALTRAELDEVVRLNEKKRLQLDGERIRACQGHSTADMPVTVEALEASWEPWRGSEPLWHGTSRHALSGIADKGLRPIRRTHVHLSSSLESPVGKRSNVDVLLEIDPSAVRSAGVPLHVAPNGVVLARRVPRAAIVDLRPTTRRCRRMEGALRACLGLT